jgi:hypothetical protein
MKSRGRKGKTHKKRHARQEAKVMSIPELRKSLEHVTSYAESMSHSGSKTEMAEKFASEWKKVFGKTLSKDDAEAYVQHVMNMKKSYKKTKKTRKLRGGAQSTELTGAPLAYMTRPGVELPYGNFEKYVSSGFWNPEPAIQYDCGKQTGLVPYASTGSNKMNGGSFTFRPFVAENPTTPMYDAMTAWKGLPLGPGPESYQRAYNYQIPPSGMSVPIASAVYERDLSKDVMTK